jgi:hypothetical protein
MRWRRQSLTCPGCHRCLRRHGIHCLPDAEGNEPAKHNFKAYPIGYFHIDIAEVQAAKEKLSLFVVIKRTSRFAFAQLVKKISRITASAFLVALVAAVRPFEHIASVAWPAVSAIATSEWHVRLCMLLIIRNNLACLRQFSASRMPDPWLDLDDPSHARKIARMLEPSLRE